MLTKDDLRSIVNELSPLIKAEGEATRKAIEEKVELSNEVHATLFKVELNTVKNEIIDAIKIGFQETTNQIKEARERIEVLEEHTELNKPHKN